MRAMPCQLVSGDSDDSLPAHSSSRWCVSANALLHTSSNKIDRTRAAYTWLHLVVRVAERPARRRNWLRGPRPRRHRREGCTLPCAPPSPRADAKSASGDEGPTCRKKSAARVVRALQLRDAMRISLSALLLAACTGVAPVGSDESPIIGGMTTTGDPAVVLLVAMTGQGEAYCTAEIVSPHVVMTAAH